MLMQIKEINIYVLNMCFI